MAKLRPPVVATARIKEAAGTVDECYSGLRSLLVRICCLSRRFQFFFSACLPFFRLLPRVNVRVVFSRVQISQQSVTMASTSLINCTPQKMMSPPVLMNNSPPLGGYMPINSTPNRMPIKRPIQPGTSSGIPSGHSSSAAKKRIQFSSLGYVLPPPPPASVARRNARERNRVKQVNMGFAILRQHIPSSFGSSSSRSSSSSGSKSRKVSKVDTLRCAVEYIRSLKEMLDDNENAPSSSASSTSSDNMSPPANVHSGAKQSFTYSSSQAEMGGHHHHSATSLSPSCSDASSPTPSYGSEHSYFTASSWDPYDTYEAYEAPDLQDAAPNDDELLDAISWWQQSQ